MSISFPAIVSEWVVLDSLASSSRTDVLSDPSVKSIAKPVVGVKRIFKSTAPVLLSSHRWFEGDPLE